MIFFSIIYSYRKLAWFMIDYFDHNIDLIAQSGKSFQPDDENV